MSAWRCTGCGVSWPGEPDPRIRPPLDPSYRVCAICEQPCDQIGNEDGIEPDSARLLKLWSEFDRFYEKRQTPDLSLEAA